MQIMNTEAQLSKKAVKVTCRVSLYQLFCLLIIIIGGRLSKPTHSSSPCQSELQGQQELLSKERKEREYIVSDYKKKTEKHKAPAEKVEGKVLHRSRHFSTLIPFQILFK